MTNEQPGGLSAASGRIGLDAIQQQRQSLGEISMVKTLLDGSPDPMIVLNPDQRIVLANDRFQDLAGCTEDQLLGLRLGEALGCDHAFEAEGCGTRLLCRTCGASQAVEHARSHQEKAARECHLTCEGPGALDLGVWATPLTLAGRPFTILAMRDRTDEKRRQVLERIYFHDLLNAAGGLRGLLEIWPELTGAEAVEVERTARQLAEQLVEEIQSQRDLVAAERGDLTVEFTECDAAEVLMRLALLYSHHPVAQARRILPPRVSGPTRLFTSEVLLGRILGNLIKNALEASAPGQAVQLEYANAGTPTFRIHNEAVMPEEARRHVFQRSFTTRGGQGRGLGTYSVKLLAERYLRGAVSFETDPEKGTTFTVQLPPGYWDPPS